MSKSLYIVVDQEHPSLDLVAVQNVLGAVPVLRPERVKRARRESDIANNNNNNNDRNPSNRVPPLVSKGTW